MSMVIHYLDDVRHDLAFMWVWTNWIGNISAGVVVFIVMSMFWPPLRDKYKNFFAAHMTALHQKLDHQHDVRMQQADAHHAELLTLSNKQHEEHIKVITDLVKKTPRRKKTITPNDTETVI